MNIESGAGILAGFSDAMYERAGARIQDSYDVWRNDIVIKVRKPVNNEPMGLNEESML